MIFSGTTNGATVEPGEPFPSGGEMDGLYGSVWFQMQAEAPGFMTVVAERTGEDMDQWPYVGVWEGDTATPSKASLIAVRPYRRPPAGGPNNQYEPGPFFFEIRQGKHYFIQVVRGPWQTWGDFDLIVEPYYETIDWDYATDGFSSTTGGIAEAGGIATCSGGIEYGTFDAGDEPPKWNREFRVYFEIECEAGTILIRHANGQSPFTDPTKASTKLGIFRLRDLDDTPVFHCYLTGDAAGNNFFTFGNDTHDADVSVGVKDSDQSGRISVEMIFMCENVQDYDSTAAVPWRLECVLVNGRLQPGFDGTVYFDSDSKRPRYFDFGFWRYTTLTAGEEAKVETPQLWTIAYRRMGVTNIVPRQPYDYHDDDRKILQFDGWAQGTTYHALTHSGTGWDGDIILPGVTDETLGAYPLVVANPGARSGYALRSNLVDYYWPPLNVYGEHNNSRRWYGFWLHGAEWPEFFKSIAGWNYTHRIGGNTGMASFGLEGNELTITPYRSPRFCVARLKEGEDYWIEVHADAEVLWDVRCEVFINHESFGTYSNKVTYAQAFTDSADLAGATTEHANSGYNIFTLGLDDNDTNHDLYFGTVVVGRGDPENQVGPLDVVAQAAIDDVGVHGIPAAPGDFYDLWGNRNGVVPQFADKAYRVYGWATEDIVGDFTKAWPQVSSFYTPSNPGAIGCPTRSYTDPTEGALGDDVLAVCLASGAGKFKAAQEWDPGGVGGSIEPSFTHPELTLSGDLQLAWSKCLPYWSSILGTGVYSRASWNTGSGTLTIEDYRLLKNPLVYPRYAHSDDGGATWTWIEPGETDSALVIGNDISVDDGIARPALFTDTSAALSRMQVNDGNIAGHGATAHRAFKMPHYYVEYNAQPTESVDPVRAINIWTRFKGHWGQPSQETALHRARMRMDYTLDSGGRSKGKTFANVNTSNAAQGSTMDDRAVIDRVMLPRDPLGEVWTPEKVEELLLRVGYHEYILEDQNDYGLHTDAQAVQTDQRLGAVVYAMSIERLVDAEAGIPPPSCAEVVSMNWRFNARPFGGTKRILVDAA